MPWTLMSPLAKCEGVDFLELAHLPYPFYRDIGVCYFAGTSNFRDASNNSSFGRGAS